MDLGEGVIILENEPLNLSLEREPIFASKNMFLAVELKVNASQRDAWTLYT